MTANTTIKTASKTPDSQTPNNRPSPQEVAARPDPEVPTRSPHRNAMKIVRFVLQRAGEKQLTQVASSLTFTTVLSLVPLLAVVLALFTAFPLFGEFRAALESFLTSNLMPAAVSENVMMYLNQFAAKASGLTAAGSLFLIVTSVSLIMTVDEALNNIWKVEHQRPMGQRMLVYWAIISLGPILTGASLWASATVARESLGHVNELSDALGVVLSLVPLIATGLGFTVLFTMVPNRKVLWRDALIGGICTALVLELMRMGFAFYLARFPSYTVIYGAFATLPIFLLWIYLSWLVILLGATLAAILPSLRQRRWALQHFPGDKFIDALHVLHALWKAQRTATPGRSTSFLREHLHLHDDELSLVLKELKELGYVVDTENDAGVLWVLSCDQRETDIGRLLDAMVIDRSQPGLYQNPALLEAISTSVAGEAVRLETLFETGTALSENPVLVHNTKIKLQNHSEEGNHAESQ
ncbi:YihY family inner membrane protein [Pusillimonas sp. ANT_WB101]|uniref:YihY family inner membrane protein n=1 Tax=Pusillimonas sp. ANT_WB101 TaxID=2597356 RepID=UPI0011EBE68F|nr:YihY family inner membrane protein [Pusillimonas sp. ANT_WB101]KAA0911675.1 YihY family inner membrane protein [Pusillimonas sp. ANT_WB101]